jgi:hypothetical protein
MLQTGRRGLWKAAALGVLFVALLSGAGCLQIEATLKLDEEGKGKLTERVCFSGRLLDLAGDKRGELVGLLSRERVSERVKAMGEGVTLTRHEVKEAGDGSMEALSEMSVPDLNKFQYVSPWLGNPDYPGNNAVRCSLEPVYAAWTRGYERHEPPGSIAVTFRHVKAPARRARYSAENPAPKGPAPAELQPYREIGPVLADMLKGFRLRLTFDSYASAQNRLGMRGAGHLGGATAVDLIDISDANMDSWGGLFLENEEAMLELAQWDLGGPNVVRQVEGFAKNVTLPVFTPGCDWDRILFAPSKALFDKYFAGKTLDYGEERWGGKKPAKFEDIGWQGWKERQAKEKKPEEPAGGGGVTNAPEKQK